MKRRTPHARTARRGFALRPLALSIALALPGSLFAGGVDPTVAGGQAAVSVNGNTTTVTQGSSRAIIDWRSLSLTQQEKFRVLQGSAKDVLLNRITGSEASVLDGSIQALGRVYFLNPNGIIFGEHAQIDVGGLVASTLALSNEDFMAGRIQLTPTTGAGDYAGRVINRGRINAAGGEIVLAGLNVANEGTLSAPGGRVGLVAADEVLVDVEGDGLLFFNVKAADAGARVAQLGRIEADGGTVQLRAEARAGFADTVLNLDGVVQARSLGARNGRVVVDGGAAGVTEVAGSIDATGSAAGQTGGRITVTGDRTLLASTAVLDASGAAGGGIQVGGGFQGGDAAVRNATVTGVVGGAVLRANAQQAGDGGQVVVWADDTTRYQGRIESKGGAQGGNGGQVEVSGKLSLGYRGTVDTSAAAGRVGTLLLDPRDLAVTNNAGGTAISWTAAAGVNGSTDAEVDVASINSSTADVTLTASRNMGINAAINITNAGTTFSATATNNINVIADITTNGGAISLSGGTLTLGANLDAGAAAVSLTGPVTLAGGARSITGSTIGINNSLAGASHALTLAATGTATLAGNVTGVSTLTSTTGTTAINAEVTTSGTQSYGAVTLGGSGTGRTLTGGGVTLGAVTGNGKDLGIVGGLTLNGDVTGVATLASTGSPTTINANVNTTAGQAYGAVTLGGSSATRTLTAGTTVSVGAVTGAGNSLTVAATTSATLGGTVAGVAALDTTGSTTTAVNADVTTTGNQAYGAMTLGGSGGTRTLAGSTVALGTVAGGGKNLTVNGSTSATIGGAVTNVAALDTSGSAATALNANVTTTGAQTYNLATLGGNTALGGSSVTFNGAVAGASHGLTVTTAGVLALNGGASGLSTLDASAATGGSSIGGNVTTSGAQTYAGTTTLTAAASFQGGSLGFNNLAAGSNALGLRADAVTVSGTATGSGTATFEPLSNTGSIGVAGGTGTLQLSQALLNKFGGFGTIAVGSLANDYAISFGNFSLPANMAVRSNSGNISFQTLNGAHTLQAQTTGTISMNDIVGGTADLTSIDLNGTVTVNTTAVQTSGTQTYTGAVTLQQDTVLDGSTVGFSSTVDGTGRRLEINGNASFGGVVGAGGALSSLDVSGTSALAGNVSTTGTQVYGGAVTLSAASTTLAGSTVEFNGTVNGTAPNSQALAITGNADIGGVVGGTNRLAGLTVSGTTALSSNVTTSGAQAYTGNVTLGGNSSLTSTASTIGFTGTVNGGFALATSTAAGTTFGGAVGGSAALSSLAVSAGTATLNGGAVTTTGNQTYGGTVTLGADTTFTGTNLSIPTLNVAGNDIGLRLGGTLGIGTILNASGATASIAARDASTSIGVAGGAGTFQVSQSTIDQFASFSTVAVGRSDGSGTVTFGNATINRTLGVVTGSGDINFGSIQTNVDGVYNLTATSASGTIRFNGDVGTVSRLANLTVNGASRIGAASIFTAGNQTYTGAVTLAADATINANVLDFQGTIDGARNLSTTGFSVTHFRGAVGGSTALTSLDAAGVVDTRASITATGSQTYGGSMTLLDDATFTASTLSFNTLNAGTHDLGLVYDNMSPIPSLSGSGTVRIAPYTASTDIHVAVSGTPVGMVIDSATFTQYSGFSGLIIGRAGTSGTIEVGDVGGSFQLPTNLTLVSGSGAINVQAAVDGNGHSLTLSSGTGAINLNAAADAVTNLTLSTAGLTTIAGSLGQGSALGSFTSDGGGTTRLAGNVRATGAIDIDDTVVLTGGASSLQGSSVAFGGDVLASGNGTQSLSVTGPVTLAGDVGSASQRLSSANFNGTARFAGGDVFTTGSQIYHQAVTLDGDVSMSSTGSFVEFVQTIDGAHALTLSSASANWLEGAVGGSTALASLTTTGTTRIYSSVRTSGNQSYGGQALLANAATVTSTGGTATFTGGLTGQALTVNAAGLTTIGGSSSLAGLTVNGATRLTGTGINTGSGDQTYTGAVTLASDSTLAGTNIGFGSTIDGAHNLTVNASAATTFGGDIGQSVALTSLTTDAAGTTTLPAKVSTTAAQAYRDAVILAANTELAAVGLNLAGLSGASHALKVTSSAAVNLNGAISGLSAFDAAGTGTVNFIGNAGLATTGAQHYGGGVQVSLANASFSGSSLDFDGALASGTNLTLTTDSLDAAGAISGAGTFTLTPTSTGTSIGLAGEAGALRVDLGQVSGFTQTIIGRTDGTGAINVGAVTLGTATTLRSGTGAINFNGTVDGAQALVANTGGTTTFSGAVGGTTALASLTTDAGGSTAVNGGSVRTSGAQNYGDAVTYGGAASFTGSALNFGGGASGGTNLTLTADGFSVTGSLSGSGVLTIQPLAGSTTIGLSGGAGALQITQSALSQFSGFASQVFGRTDGTAPINVGAFTLARDTTVRAAGSGGSNISFGSTVNGAHDLVVNTGGVTTFSGAVGGSTPLASLTTDAGGSTVVGGGLVSTSGTQDYNDAVTYGGAATFSADTLDFAFGAGGGTDLTLSTDHLSVGGALSGTGVLTLSPRSTTTSIGLAGGTGTLQLTQSMLSQIAGFTRTVIGHAGGSGDIRAGVWTLSTDTLIQSQSGDAYFTTIDGAHGLTVNTGGVTAFVGDIGATTRLASLSTDAAGSTLLGASAVRTSGDITLADRVTATGALLLDATSAGNVTASDAGNDIDGPLSLVANRVDLASHSALSLGQVSLGAGGQIATDGVLTLTGNIDQATAGGELTLTARATPTTIGFTDADLASLPRIFNGLTLQEASGVIRQTGGRIATASGSQLNLLAANGGSINVAQANQFGGRVSALSTPPGDPATRFNGSGTLALGFVRLNSAQMVVGGAGIDADAVELTADRLSTATGSVIRARLPYNNTLGLETALPALTLVLSPAALDGSAGSKPYGGLPESERIQVNLGDVAFGGFLTVRPKGGASGTGTFVSLGGPAVPRPFYDGSGKLTEIQVFYNGEVPQTPQEVGALSAVTAVIEEARRARFDEAVRTENVSSRLRSGVIAEVGAGRPATEGSESIKTPQTCSVQAGTLRCAP